MLNFIFEIINNFQIAYLAKLLLLVVGLFYFVFSLVIYRQVSLMSQVLNTSATWFLKMLIVIQMAIATAIFVLVIVLV
jgi:hypothetical protein